MQYSIVNYSEVKNNPDFRYEAEFFLPKYIEEENILSKLNTIDLSSCAKFTNGHAFGSGEFSDDGDVFVSKIGDVTQKRPYLLWERVSRLHFEELNGKYLDKNDILMTLTGDPPDVGKVQIIFNPPEKQLSWNQRVARLKLKKQDQINSQEYLFSVLSSKYCRDHIERWAKGIRQRNVGNPAVLNMKIPVFSNDLQDQIQKTIVESFTNLESSKSLYASAENLLLSELGLETWKPRHKLSFVKNFSDTIGAERIDAEYFQPKYDEIIEKIRKYKGGFDTLGNITKVKDKNFNPETEETYKYIELSNISGNGEITGFTEALGSELPSRARRKVKAGDVIVSSIEGSLESVALVNGEFENALCSTGFFVITSKEINSETLLCFLKTIAGQLQLKKGCKGTILTAISKTELERILIPTIKPEIQKQIKEKIIEMYKSKQESKDLLEKAKKAVEIAIEESEGEAMEFLES